MNDSSALSRRCVLGCDESGDILDHSEPKFPDLRLGEISQLLRQQPQSLVCQCGSAGALTVATSLSPLRPLNQGTAQPFPRASWRTDPVVFASISFLAVFHHE